MGTYAIAAVDPTGLLGVTTDGLPRLPWSYRADLRRFQTLTQGCVLVMGRVTYESLPGPLRGRRLVVVSGSPQPASCHAEVWAPTPERALYDAQAMAEAQGVDVWICGGAQLYEWALRRRIPTRVDLTVVPEAPALLAGETPCYFPHAALTENYAWNPSVGNPGDARLVHGSWELRSTT